MTRLYCPECSEYLEGGDGECHDCSCGWKQPVETFEDEVSTLQVAYDELCEELEDSQRQLEVAAEFCRQLQIENKQLRASTADCYEKNLNLNLENFELKAQLAALQESFSDLENRYEDVVSQEHSMPELRGQLLDAFTEKQKAWVCIERLTLSVTNTVKERDELMRKNNHLQFLLDSVMLEFCPDEMTEEQMENWKKAQSAVDTADPEYYKLDTYKNNIKFSADMIK